MISNKFPYKSYLVLYAQSETAKIQTHIMMLCMRRHNYDTTGCTMYSQVFMCVPANREVEIYSDQHPITSRKESYTAVIKKHSTLCRVFCPTVIQPFIGVYWQERVTCKLYMYTVYLFRHEHRAATAYTGTLHSYAY